MKRIFMSIISNNLSVIIVVVENDRKYLRSCLSSIRKSADNIHFSLQTIIIAVATDVPDFPELKIYNHTILRFNRKTGYSYCINSGMKKAKSNWVILISPDVLLQSDSLKFLVRHISDKKVAVIGPKITDPDGNLNYTILPEYSLKNIFLEQSYLYKVFPGIFNHPYSDEEFYSNTHSVNGLMAICWLMNKEIFKKVGGYDERFFFYFDDTDFCKRVTNMGCRIMYEPRANVIHLGQKGSNGIVQGKRYAESMYKYLGKYHHTLYVRTAFWIFLSGTVLRLCFWKIKRAIGNKESDINNSKNKIIYLSELIRNCVRYI